MMDDKRNNSLQSALRLLADETAEARPPARIERELKGRLRRTRMARYPWWIAAAAGVALVGFWTLREESPRQVTQPTTIVVEQQPVELPPVVEVEPDVPAARPAVLRASRNSRPNELVSELSPLTPWFYSEGLPRPARGQIVLIRVSPETASRFGVLSDQPVPAQLLIGDDGLTRAIRLVQ
jgi:hypothetical protein